jgi:hypothetical protein
MTVFILTHLEVGVIFVAATNDAMNAYLKGRAIDMDLEYEHGYRVDSYDVATSTDPQYYAESEV